MAIEAYKPGQAKSSRTLVLLSGLFLAVWGCVSLAFALSRFEKLQSAWNEEGLLGHALPDAAWRLDLGLFETKISPAFTIAAVVCVGVCFWWWRFLHRPRSADLLIEMEAELRKVSWPTFSDAWQSTLIVSAFTAALVATILVCDLVIRLALNGITGRV